MTSRHPCLADPDLMADPDAGWSRFRESSAVVEGRTPTGSPVWHVTRDADVRAVLADPRLISDRYLLNGIVPSDGRARSLINRDGADHARLRGPTARVLSVGRVRTLRPRIAALIDELLDGVVAQNGAPVELVEAVFRPFAIGTFCELVDIPPPFRPAWHRWSEDLRSGERERMLGALHGMQAQVAELMARSAAGPDAGVVAELLRLQRADPARLSDNELVSAVHGLFTAGHETVTHQLGNAVHALLTHPEQLAAVRADPTLWPAAVDELVRWSGSVLVPLMRYATEDVRVGGITVRRGESVRAMLVSANRDPRVYPNPDQLDVTRASRHLGFGHGRHVCPGAALSRMQLELALSALFGRFPAPSLHEDPRWGSVPGMRQLDALPVVLTPA